MSGETESNVSGWTTDTLRFHLEQEIADLRTHYDQVFHMLESALLERYVSQTTAITSALTSAEKAVTKAETASEKRFDNVNEFRGQLADQARTFMPRTEAISAIERNAERITEVSNLALTHVTRSEIDILTSRTAERISELTDRFNKSEGKDTGAGLEEKVNQLSVLVNRQSDAIATGQGRSGGFNAAWGYAIGAVGVLSTIIVLIFRATGN